MDFITQMETDFYAFLDQINFYFTAAKVITALILIFLVVLISITLSIKTKVENNERIITRLMQIKEDETYRKMGIDPDDPKTRQIITMTKSGNKYHADNAKSQLENMIKAKGEKQNE